MVCTSRKPPSVCMIIYWGRQGNIWGLPLCNVSSFVITVFFLRLKELRIAEKTRLRFGVVARGAMSCSKGL